jgi:hypothetical protein
LTNPHGAEVFVLGFGTMKLLKLGMVNYYAFAFPANI